jgi:hypothetical protein
MEEVRQEDVKAAVTQIAALVDPHSADSDESLSNYDAGYVDSLVTKVAKEALQTA